MGIIKDALNKTPIRKNRKNYIEVDFEKEIDKRLEEIPEIKVSKIKYSDGVVFLNSNATVVIEMKVNKDGNINNFLPTLCQAFYNAIELFGNLTLDKHLLIVTDSYYAFLNGMIVEMLYDNILPIYKDSKAAHVTARNFYKNYNKRLDSFFIDIKSVTIFGTDFTDEEFLKMINIDRNLI